MVCSGKQHSLSAALSDAESSDVNKDSKLKAKDLKKNRTRICKSSTEIASDINCSYLIIATSDTCIW